jgi:hypothetical protein
MPQQFTSHRQQNTVNKVRLAVEGSRLSGLSVRGSKKHGGETTTTKASKDGCCVAHNFGSQVWWSAAEDDES